VASVILQVPSREDLLKLAQAALANAGDLLADARLLAEAGSFPRAHALAALACEELGKEHQCLRALSLPPSPKAFWNSFKHHRGKLEHAHALAMLYSGESICFPDLFNARVRELTRLAHERKLRGLYVDYTDGGLQLPSHIAEQEARQLIDLTQEVLDRDRADWTEQVDKAQWLCQFSPTGRLLWSAWIYWAVYTYPEIVMRALRDGAFAAVLIDLAPQFEQQVRSAGSLPAFLETLATPADSG
jgi:AbiV family abortive infection protein